MDKKKVVNYWLEICESDLGAGKSLFKSGWYLYVGFQCHQVIEKVLKAYYVNEKNETPPYTHNLIKLATDSDLFNEFNEQQKELIKTLLPLNIEARYPTYKDEMNKFLTKEICKKILKETEELYKWIKEKL
jgi:HEPN domain-containing protein